MERFCYINTLTNGIGIVKEGESGYYKTDLAECNGIDISDHAKLDEFVSWLNDRLGVTKEEATMMQLNSMFKW